MSKGSKGWTVEVTVGCQTSNRLVCLQSFDIAIENQMEAESMARQRAGNGAVIQASRQRSYLSGLSPGRVRAGRTMIVPRSRLAVSA